MTACTQPGCTGTFVDDYCDVCGSPASAADGVAAEACAQPGCTGTIVDGYCDICGSPAGIPASTSAKAATAPPASAASLIAVPRRPGCTQAGCTGTIVDGYCDVCGLPPSAAESAPGKPAATPAPRAPAPAKTAPIRTKPETAPAKTAAAAAPPATAPAKTAATPAKPETAPAKTAAAAASAASPTALSQLNACTQPRCTGTIVDGRCDVCGSPVGATDAVSAAVPEGAAAAAPPAPAARPALTAIRRAVGVAAVLFLIACAVVFYRIAPGFSTSGATPRTGASSAASPATTTVGTPTSTPSASDNTASRPPEQSIELQALVDSAKPFQIVRIEGTYPGGADTFVQVQHWDSGRWVPFPLPAKTDKSGKFTAYVEPGPPGRYRLRVLDPRSGTTSKIFVIVIKA